MNAGEDAAPLVQEYAAGLAYDLETTGLDTSSCEIVQFAVVVVNSKRPEGIKFSSLVMPKGDIDPGAASVHGLTREVLAARGARPFADAWAECNEFILDALGPTRPLVWTAHNGDKFDQPILTRCVEAAEQRSVEEGGGDDGGGGLASILCGPRARFVDTLPLAKAALPGRKWANGMGPYTLSSLYKSASGGESLEGAHDALADTEALATVWRWLVEEAGADAPSTAWRIDGEREPPNAFQRHLQWHAYLREKYELAAKRAAPKKARARKPSTTSASSASSADADDSLLRVNGIGPTLASRLRGQGIETYDDLERLFVHSCGGQRTRMIGWMKKSMPGLSTFVLAKAAKGMSAEFESEAASAA